MANITRRDFFKGMAVLGGSIVLSGSLIGCKKELDGVQFGNLIYLEEQTDRIWLMKMDSGYIYTEAFDRFNVYDTEYDSLLSAGRQYNNMQSMIIGSGNPKEDLLAIDSILQESNQNDGVRKGMVHDKDGYHFLKYDYYDEAKYKHNTSTFHCEGQELGPVLNTDCMLLGSDIQIFLDPALASSFDLPDRTNEINALTAQTKMSR